MNYYEYVDKRLKCLAEIKIIILFQAMWGNKRLSTMLNDLGVGWSMRDGASVIRDDIENIWGKVSGTEN